MLAAGQAVATLLKVVYMYNIDAVTAANEAMDASVECSEWRKVWAWRACAYER